MSEFTIERATPADAAELIRFLKTVGAETDNLTFGAEGLPISVAQEADYIKELDSRDLMLVARKDGILVGNASLSCFFRRMAHRAELGISVVRSEWGEGIGKALISECIKHAKENGITLITLEVRSDNSRATGLYKKFGFVKTGVIPNYFLIDGRYFDFDIMSLVIK